MPALRRNFYYDSVSAAPFLAVLAGVPGNPVGWFCRWTLRHHHTSRTLWLRGKSPIYLLQLVASGLLGKSSFQGGLATAVLGLCCHFLIAITAAAVFYTGSSMLTFLLCRSVPFGLLYGIMIYAFMRFVVLPLSAIHAKMAIPPIPGVTRDVLIHMIMVGLPISLLVRKYSVYKPGPEHAVQRVAV